MTDGARRVQRTYLTLTLLSTLAASFIWGINTLFLLDAGLSNTEAFAANAFFTVGQFLFEVPTGVIADTWGRRLSYLLGSATLLASTLLYLLMWQTEAGFVGWAIASMTIGLGFTFFSGAVEAWLVDALGASGFTGDLESVFARGQVVMGVAMLTGAVAGGFIAQLTSLGVPYIIRAVILAVTLLTAVVLMHDEGFTPDREAGFRSETRKILRASIDHGWRNRPVRWVMLSAPFISGVMFYAFYAMQPYLLELYGDETAFGIAGIAAAIFAGAQIVGGLSVPYLRRLVRHRTSVLLLSAMTGSVGLVVIGLAENFWVTLALIVLWATLLSAMMPMRQAFVNQLIPSEERATVLSFDALMGSSGGIVAQPALGRVADVSGYAASYVVSGLVQAAAIPFLLLARRERSAADLVEAG